LDAPAIFFFFGFISLAMQTYEDIKTLQVDQRRSYYMYGAIISLALMTGLNLWYIAAVIGMLIFTALIKMWESKNGKKILGAGDFEILAWIVPGLVLLGQGLFYPILYLISFALALAGFKLISFASKSERLPGTIPIAAAFMIVLAAFAQLSGMTL
jgi:hypothetical protein